MRLFMIADDFTGALDAGVQFAKKGFSTGVLTSMPDDLTEYLDLEVCVIDAETRHKSPEQAYGIVSSIMDRVQKYHIPYIMKKTDSALRGNVGAELSAVLKNSREQVLSFLPAFPKMKRVTKKGIHYIDGVPVHESVFGTDPFNPVLISEVGELICTQSETAVISACKDFVITEAKDQTIVVYDCSTEEDMREIASSLTAQDAFHVFAGCAGLAEIVPEICGWKGREKEFPVLPEHFLVICGSVNPITVRQLEVAEEHGFVRIMLTPEQKLDIGYFDSEQGRRFLENLKQICDEKDRIIIDSNDPKGSNATYLYAEEHGIAMEELRVRIADHLGILTDELMNSGREKAVLMTGGDTLFGCIRHMDQAQLSPVGEIDTGVVLSELMAGQRKSLVFTKSGGFGEEDLLVKMGKRICKENG